MVFPHRFTRSLLLCLSLLFAAVASAAPTLGSAPVNITADSLSHDAVKGIYEAEGNVLVTDGAVILRADRVIYHLEEGTADAEGNVRLQSEGDEVSADAVTYTMESQEGTITNGTVFIKSRNLWIHSDTLEKRGENRYIAERARITTCDGENPDWAITGRNFDITIEGYGTAHHVMLETAGVPVVYTPFLLFPVKIKRQTGLMPPTLTYSSRKGMDLNLPLFIALGDSMDTTVYTNYMSERGTKLGVELRYMASALSKGTFVVEGFNDRQIDDGTREGADYGYSGTPNRTNTDRYWLRGKADQSLPGGFTAKLDLDWVSDQDYLREFKDGPGGFTDTQDGMEKFMGRNIEDYTDTVRTNGLSVVKSTDAFTASVSGIWNDNVITRSQETDDNTLQQLPSLSVTQSRGTLGTTPFQVSLEGGASKFYRQDLTSTTYDGERTYILPKLYMPFKVGAFSIDPRAGLRGLWWDTNTFDGTSPLSGTQTAAVPEFTTDLSTEFYRIFDTESSWADRVNHRIKPTLTYDWQERLNDTLYPTFDTVDDLDGKNEVTLKIFSTLTSKKGAGDTPAYRDFLTGTLSQAWDIQEERETDPAKWRNNLTQEPFKPFYAELVFHPASALSLTLDGTWSWYESEILTQNTSLTLGRTLGPRLSLSHRKKRDPLESIHEDLGIPPRSSYNSSESLVTTLDIGLGRGFSLDLEYERDLLNSIYITQKVGITYKASCWSVFAQFEDSTDDTKIFFGVELTGFAGYSSSYGIDSPQGPAAQTSSP